MSQEVRYNIGPLDDRVPPPIEDQQLGPGLGLQGLNLGGQVQGDRQTRRRFPRLEEPAMENRLFRTVGTMTRLTKE